MIRKANEEDLPRILEIYENAKKFMAENGNPDQWGKEYPSKEIVWNDLEKGQLYVEESAGELGAVFVFFIGQEPSYQKIYQGAWKNDRPYGTLHRIAVARYGCGIASQCVQWCLQQCKNMRGDTHAKNKSMQRLFEKNGFVRCGIIYVEDGTERIAFQKETEEISR